MNLIQQVFREHFDAWLAEPGSVATGRWRKVAQAIIHCRDGHHGHHIYQCPDCGEKSLVNCSCGDRHCPVCQNEKAAAWVEGQEDKRLPCAYFLVTLTLPEQIRELALANQKAVYSAMLEQGAASLRTLLADRRFVGCQEPGFYAVLHTWGRQLQYHPHVHFVVPGGGLSKDRKQWVAAKPGFLVHVKALSRMFRGKMRAAFERTGLSDRIPGAVWRREWVAHCQSVGDGRAVETYLGAYVFRVAVSAKRIIDYDGENVTIAFRKVGSNRTRKLVLSAFEFIRRFLLHVLPKGFIKVRHYGFMSPNFGVPIPKIKEMICVLYEILRDAFVKPVPKKSKLKLCPVCQQEMVWVKFLPPVANGASP